MTKNIKEKIALAVTVILLLISIAALIYQRHSMNKTYIQELHGIYTVTRVVDGDTIVVSLNGEETKVRFIGIDTPESVNPDESKNTANGIIASQWTKDFLDGKQVYLEYDVQKTDKYGRTLAYVYLLDGKTMVQYELLKNGLAEIMTIEPNTRYEKIFIELEKEAKENKIGFWSE